MDIAIVCAYFTFLISYGFYHSRKVKDLKDFSVSVKRYGVFILFASMSASFIGGGFSMGNASETFQYGVGNIFALFGFSFGQIIIGLYFLPRIRNFSGITSPGGIMRRAYGRGGQLLCGLSATLLCVGMLGAQIAAVGSIFNVLLGIDYRLGAVIGFAAVLVYSTLGGIGAVVGAEILEFVLLCVGMPVLLFFSLRAGGGMDAVLRGLPAAHFDILNNKSPAEFLSLFLTLMIGEAFIPPYVQRMLMGKDVGTVSTATVMSGLLSMPFFVVTGLVGLCAYVLIPLEPANMAMPGLVLRVLPVGVCGLVVSSLLAIVISSADAILNSASIAIVNDITVPLLRRKPSDRRLLSLARAVNLLVGLCGMGFALFIPNVFKLLLMAYNFWCPVVLVPLAAALLGVKAGKRAFLFGSCGGIAAALLWTYALGSPFGLGGTVVGFAVNLMLFLAVYRQGLHKGTLS